MAARILASSSIPGVAFTVIHGYFASNPLMISSRPLNSLLDHPVQNVMVTGACEALGFTVGGALAWLPAPAVHAVASSTRPNGIVSFLNKGLIAPPSFLRSSASSHHDLSSAGRSCEQPVLRGLQRHRHGPQDGRVLPDH